MTQQEIRWLDDLGAEFARMARREQRSAARPVRRIAAIGASVLVLLGAGYAVPATRAGIDDLTSSFAGWVANDNAQAPGRPLSADDNAPDWVRDGGGRLIAESHGVRLFVSRIRNTNQGTLLAFTLAGGNMQFGTVDGWRKRFDEHAVVVLGTAPAAPGRLLDDRGRFPLMGVTARPVTKVELRYAYGPSLDATDVHGGFVLFADSTRPLRDLIAFDAAGHELDRADVTTFAPR